MEKLLFRTTALMMLLLVTAVFAVPDSALTHPQPAFRVAESTTLAAIAVVTPIPSPAPTVTITGSEHPQIELKARAIPTSNAEPHSDSSLTVANSFTSLNTSLTIRGTAVLPSSASSSTGLVAIGSFTAADGGVYDVTSQNGYVVIDGKTLAPGQGALIGNEEVSDGSKGLMAHGQTVALSTMTPTAAAMTTTEGKSTATSGQVSSGTSTANMNAASSRASAASAAASSSSAAGAAQTDVTGGLVAAAGGLLGLLLL